MNLTSAWRLIILTSLAIIYGCGGAGDGGGKSGKPKGDPAPTPTPSADAGKYETNVGLNLLGDTPPRLAGCDKPEALKLLGEIENHEFDGRLDEWSDEQKFATDRSGDSWGSGDIEASYLALVDSTEPELVGYLSGDLTVNANRQLYIDFGFLSTEGSGNKRRIGPRVQRSYRFVTGGRIEEQIDDEWRSIDSDVAGWVNGSLGIEWRINRRQVDEVLLKDLWFHSVRLVESDEVVDEQAVRYSPAIDSVSSPNFKVTNCGADTSGIFPLSFQQIVESDIDPDMATSLFGILRLAYESLQLSLSHDLWPTQRLTIILSKSKAIKDYTALGEDHRRTLYDGFVFRWNSSVEQKLTQGRYSTLFYELQSAMLEGLLKSYRPDANIGELAWAAETIKQWNLRRYLSYGAWLDYLPANSKLFRLGSDTGAPLGLLARYERWQQPFPDSSERQRYQRYTEAKTVSAAAVASMRFEPEQILSSWQYAAAIDDFRRALNQISGNNELITSLFAGWMTDEPYQTEWNPGLLLDDDYDGLMNFIELDIGSDKDSPDTDEDGWTDYGEFLTESQFNNRSKMPGVIIADGYFGDWQELLPTRIESHDSPADADVNCSDASKIQATAGIGAGSKLILGAIAEAPWRNQHPMSWEFQVNFMRSDRQLIFRLRAGEYDLEVLEAETLKRVMTIQQALPNGHHAAELYFNLRDLGLVEDLSRRRSIRYRVTTILENSDRILCDQTAWKIPLAHEE